MTDFADFAALFEEHYGWARSRAAYMGVPLSDVDDVVAESFARVLAADGVVVVASFRPFMFVTMRNVWYDKIRKDRPIDLRGDWPDWEWQQSSPPADVGADVDVDSLRRVGDVFRGLPERWRRMLWHTEVEERSPSELADEFGVSPNGASAVAKRARAGLRRAYLAAA